MNVKCRTSVVQHLKLAPRRRQEKTPISCKWFAIVGAFAFISKHVQIKEQWEAMSATVEEQSVRLKDLQQTLEISEREKQQLEERLNQPSEAETLRVKKALTYNQTIIPAGANLARRRA